MARLNARIGILGGGQLGRMSILAGRPLGLHFTVFEPQAECSAGKVADAHVAAAYDDEEALARFAASVDVVTLEFENVPRRAAEVVAEHAPLRPGVEVLWVCQHRRREKEFLSTHDIPCVRFGHAGSEEELREVAARVGLPVVVKTAAFGYDGKGQAMVDDESQLADAWAKLQNPEGVVVEQKVDFVRELSLVFARRSSGEMRFFPLVENEHRNHILYATQLPAPDYETLQPQAENVAAKIAEAFQLEGLLAVEFFHMPDGRLLVNEMAPRPHNSGHASLEGSETSQFEQHLRAVLDLPLGSTAVREATLMVNLLGDVWSSGEPDWQVILQEPGAKLHLYDKGEARPGRKMGHFSLRGADMKELRARADELLKRL